MERVQQFILNLTSKVAQTSKAAEQLDRELQRDILDPMQQMIDKAKQENMERSTHLLANFSKLEALLDNDSRHCASVSSLLRMEVPVTVPCTQVIGGNASKVAEAGGRDQPLQSARLLPGVEEVVAGKGGGGSSGRDSTIGGSISSPVQSEERRQQLEEIREVEAAVTGGDSVVQRTKFTALLKQA